MDTDTLELARKRLKQVFQYLQAVNERRSPVVRQISEQPWLLRLNDLPNHPCLQRCPHEGEILVLRKPVLTPCPQPPDSLLDWLADGWQEPDQTVEVAEVRNVVTDQDVTISERFDDDSLRHEQLDSWRVRRTLWQDAELPARAAHKLYERLFALYSLLERESENFELMLGDGFFNWRLDSGGMHHPILLKRVELHFDPRIPAFTLEENDNPVELYTSLFSDDAFAGLPVNRWREELASGEIHPLGREGVEDWLRGVIGSFQDGEFVTGEPVGEKTHPRLGRTPVVFLRKRNLGYAAAMAQVLDHLDQATTFPPALLALVGINIHDAADTEVGEVVDDYANEDDTVLLSKPANVQQLQIARRLEKHHAVLVQGPPGTGKTHTIANLIGHLLAQGKSILITSHTTKALRVVREQVVESLRPLCVSVLDSDISSRKQLETAIHAISERMAQTDRKRLVDEANTLAAQRLEIRNTLRDARATLQKLIANEYRDLLMGGETISPADAARFLAEGNGQHDWLPGPLEPGAILPLSATAIQMLYAQHAECSRQEEQDAAQPLPTPAQLWSPAQFEHACREWQELDQHPLPYRTELWRDEHTDLPEDLPERLRQVAQTLPDIERDSWRLAVIQTGVEGQTATVVWEALCDDIEEVWRLARECAPNILRYGPRLADDLVVDQQYHILEDIVKHLAQGKKLGGLTLTSLRWRKLIKKVRVDQGKPTTHSHFQALLDVAKMVRCRDYLKRIWDRQMTPLGAPASATLGETLEDHCIQYVTHIRRCLTWHEREWLPVQTTLQ